MKAILNKPLLIAVVAVLGMSLSSVRADTISFSPSGNGTFYQVGNFDEAPGNSLAQGAIPIAPGKSFTLLYQARMAAINDANNQQINGTGLNSSFYLTVVAKLHETVTSFTPGSPLRGATATFSFDASQASTFQVYYTTTAPSDLAGTGFNTGKLILAGTITDSFGLFGISSNSLVAFDQSPNGNQYPGIQTVQGTGGANIAIDSGVTFEDPAFFASQISSIAFDSVLRDPYDKTDPSALFFDGSVPNHGPVNGVTGTDFQFQTDGANSFTVVPEPSSLVLLAIGFLGLFLVPTLYRRVVSLQTA